MSHFYGVLSGSRGDATRCGTPKSGMVARAMSWAGCVKVSIHHSETDGHDHFYIEQTQHPSNGAGIREVIASGIIGQPTKKEPKDRRSELALIADKLAEVRDWCEIPEEVAAGINGILDELNNIVDVCANCGHTEADHDREHGNKAACSQFSFVPFVPKKAEG